MLPIAQRALLISRSLPLRTLRPLGTSRLQSTISSSPSSTPSIVPPSPPVNKDINVPLAALPTTNLLRSLLLHSITSSPRTLKLGTKVMLANLETMDKNLLLKWGVDKTFYVSILIPWNSPIGIYAD